MPLETISVPPAARTTLPLEIRGVTVPKPKNSLGLAVDSVGALKVPPPNWITPSFASALTLAYERPFRMRSVPPFDVSELSIRVLPAWKTEPTPLISTVVFGAILVMAFPRTVSVAPPPVATAR